jgi:hypothetical protein
MFFDDKEKLGRGNSQDSTVRPERVEQSKIGMTRLLDTLITENKGLRYSRSACFTFAQCLFHQW